MMRLFILNKLAYKLSSFYIGMKAMSKISHVKLTICCEDQNLAMGLEDFLELILKARGVTLVNNKVNREFQQTHREVFKAMRGMFIDINIATQAAHDI
jgi:hypothetical protein